jgi:hypothetical protein
MALPTPAEIFNEPSRYHKTIDLAKLFNLPCHAIEQVLDPDPRGVEILRQINLGRLDPSGITEDTLAAFQATNPI